jgi:hypothetical protein
MASDAEIFNLQLGECDVIVPALTTSTTTIYKEGAALTTNGYSNRGPRGHTTAQGY